MQKAISVVHELITSYIGSEVRCDMYSGDEEPELHSQERLACDSMVLGSFIKATANIGIWPRPPEPNPHTSFDNLVQRIRAMKILYGVTCESGSGSHLVAKTIGLHMNDIEASLSGGLALETFLVKRSRVRYKF
jgi:hypothetical protein